MKKALWFQMKQSEKFAPAIRRIKPVSAARAKQNSEYERLKRAWQKLAVNWGCVIAGCETKADRTPHHKFGRSGKLLNAVEHWIPVCNEHHRMIHDNPNWARSLGLLAPSGEWRNPK